MKTNMTLAVGLADLGKLLHYVENLELENDHKQGQLNKMVEVNQKRYEDDLKKLSEEHRTELEELSSAYLARKDYLDRQERLQQLKAEYDSRRSLWLDKAYQIVSARLSQRELKLLANLRKCADEAWEVFDKAQKELP